MISASHCSGERPGWFGPHTCHCSKIASAHTVCPYGYGSIPCLLLGIPNWALHLLTRPSIHCPFPVHTWPFLGPAGLEVAWGRCHLGEQALVHYGQWSFYWQSRLGPGEEVGLVPRSICSVKFVWCKESLNSCNFKRKQTLYLTLLCSRFTYTRSLELRFS